MFKLKKYIKNNIGIVAFSRQMGLTYQSVQNWCDKERVPLRHVLKVEQVTGIPRHELAPELFEGYERKEGA